MNPYDSIFPGKILPYSASVKISQWLENSYQLFRWFFELPDKLAKRPRPNPNLDPNPATCLSLSSMSCLSSDRRLAWWKWVELWEATAESILSWHLCKKNTSSVSQKQERLTTIYSDSVTWELHLQTSRRHRQEMDEPNRTFLLFGNGGSII